MAGVIAKNALLCNGRICRTVLAQSATFCTSSNRYDTVGFIGLGNMGGHMANNLMKAGHDLIVYDVSADSVAAAVKSGAKAAAHPAEVAAQCKKVVTMLPSSPHVKEVYTGSNSILSTAQPGSLFLDCSTIDTGVALEMAKVAAEHETMYVDAPVSGGVNGARDATLSFMVGGEDAAVAEARKLCDLMGKNVFHCGPISTGQAAKICNNMMLAISMAGVSETLNLGINLGLDPKMLTEILNKSSGRCWASEIYNPCPGVLPGVPSSNDYKGGFGTALMTKDLGLAQNAATDTKTPTPLGSLAHQIFRMMTNNKEFAEKDFGSVFKFLQQLQGK